MVDGDKSNSPRRRSLTLGGGKEWLAVLLVFILLGLASNPNSRPGPLLYFVAIGIVIYGYVRAARFLFGRKGAWFAIATILMVLGGFGVALYQSHQRFDDLVAQVEQYDQITIQRFDLLSWTIVDQVSFENNVDDDVFERVITMPELKNVSYVFGLLTRICG